MPLGGGAIRVAARGVVQTDEALFELCRRREARAWETLVRRYQDRMLNLAYQFTGSREEARDLAQEIFVRVYQTMEQFRSGANFSSWLYRLARNLCIDHYRRHRRRPQAYARSLEDVTLAAARRDQADQVVERRRGEEKLLRALDTLSEVSREAIVLREFQQFTLEEMAQQCDVPLGTIKSRISRARVELARAILRLEKGDAPVGSNHAV